MNLDRFITAQERDYAIALAEIKSGCKRSHWMWYIFPQIAGLGFSETSKFYALKDQAEAEAYLQHPVLGRRLIDISKALLELEDNHASRVFASLPGADPVFGQVLVKFYNDIRDWETLRLL